MTDDERALLAVPVKKWIVEQSIILDWHDGPREGICRLSRPNMAVYLRLVAQNTDPDQANVFSVSVLSLHDYEQIELLLQVLGSRRRPAWIPIWHFDSEEQRLTVEQGLEHAFEHSQATQLLVRTHDMVKFQEAWRQITRKEEL